VVATTRLPFEVFTLTLIEAIAVRIEPSQARSTPGRLNYVRRITNAVFVLG
jgi:hypothetical protein